MTAFEKHEQAERNMMRLARVSRTGYFGGGSGNAHQTRRLRYWMREYERQLYRIPTPPQSHD
jgi:hypothetical protein